MHHIKSLKIWSLILNSLILVAAGHGGAPIVLFEMMLLWRLITGHIPESDPFSFSVFASYDESLVAASLFSFLGQLIVILSFFISPRWKSRVELTGLSFLWMGFYYLTHNLFTDTLSTMSLFLGLPFLITSIILMFRIIKGKSQPTEVSEE